MNVIQRDGIVVVVAVQLKDDAELRTKFKNKFRGATFDSNTSEWHLKDTTVDTVKQFFKENGVAGADSDLEISVVNGKIQVTTLKLKNDPAMKDAFKAKFKATWDNDKKVWIVDASAHSEESVRAFFGAGIHPTANTGGGNGGTHTSGNKEVIISKEEAGKFAAIFATLRDGGSIIVS